MTAVSMMDAIATDRPQVVMDNFDHRSFAKRLGKRFYQFNAQEQSYLMGILINTLGQSISVVTETIAQRELKVRLLDTRQDGKISVVTLDLVNEEETEVFNYLVLYLKENPDGEFVLVNFYNVYDGKSFGQMGKALLEIDFQSQRIQRHFTESQEKMNLAKYLETTGEYLNAYNQMDGISSVFKDFGQYPIYRAQLAYQVSDSLYRKELLNLKEITPNDQSRKLYDCLMFNNKIENPEAGQCWTDFQELLLEREIN